MNPLTGRVRVADGHSDLLQELVFAEEEGDENPLSSRWLDQLRAGGVALAGVLRGLARDRGVADPGGEVKQKELTTESQRTQRRQKRKEF